MQGRGRRGISFLEGRGMIMRGWCFRIVMRGILLSLRGGKVLYTLSSLPCIGHHLFRIFGIGEYTDDRIAWRPTQSTANVLFAEYNNVNADGTRVSWAKKLTSAYSIGTILPTYSSWVDSSFLGVSAP